MAKNIEAVIFDLGNVLIDFDHTIAAKKISLYCDKSSKEIYNYFFDSELTGLFEEGKIPPEDFFIKIKEILKLDLDYERFLPIWNEIFFLSEKNRLVYETAKKLKNHYKTALLSNINVLHYNYIAGKFPLFDAFHTVLLSFELKLKKPDPLIYKKALCLLNVPPENAFYTDDRPELIEESLRHGINGFVFTGIEQLKLDFLSLGIDV